jgi:glutathione peroxidase
MSPPRPAHPKEEAVDLYQIPVTSIHGQAGSLAPWQGQVMLVVNVASKCRYTSQYSALELLYRRHRAEGFAVLGFPCDQFAGQEPGTESEILEFCLREFDISFPLFSKIAVNGPETHPLYDFLKGSSPAGEEAEAIEWNFTKFLVGRTGEVMHRYAPKFSPGDIEPDIVRALAGSPSPSSQTAH